MMGKYAILKEKNDKILWLLVFELIFLLTHLLISFCIVFYLSETNYMK